jgi:hypothetical protein
MARTKERLLEQMKVFEPAAEQNIEGVKQADKENKELEELAEVSLEELQAMRLFDLKQLARELDLPRKLGDKFSSLGRMELGREVYFALRQYFYGEEVTKQLGEALQAKALPEGTTKE